MCLAMLHLILLFFFLKKKKQLPIFREKKDIIYTI